MLAKNIAHQAILAGHSALFTATAADLLLAGERTPLLAVGVRHPGDDGLRHLRRPGVRRCGGSTGQAPNRPRPRTTPPTLHAAITTRGR